MNENEPKVELNGEEDVQMDIKTDKFKQDQVIPDEVAELLIRQISRELYNHNLYRTFANYYLSIGLIHLAEYYDLRAKEEYNHHDWIVDYLRDCNISVAYPQVDAIEVEIEDENTPFDLTITAEIETTTFIKEIYKKAIEVEDYQTKKWLAKLLNEQTEEEALSIKEKQISMVDTDWITKSCEILSFYQK